MLGKGRHDKLEEYKGYDIYAFSMSKGYETEYFYIGKDEQRLSMLYLISPQACRNVIDTHIRYCNEQQKPIYK